MAARNENNVIDPLLGGDDPNPEEGSGGVRPGGRVVNEAGDPRKGENNKIDPSSPRYNPGDGAIPEKRVNQPVDEYTTPAGGVDPIGSGGKADPLLDPNYVATPNLATGQQATTREVQKEELASHQLTGLLAGDSKYMRQARQEGLELGGGLGGTQGIRSAYSSAIKAGGPLAVADAQAYRDAAAQNMDALNDFGLANIQRQTQLELGTMDANTRLQTSHMNNTTQMSISKMNDITQRDVANLNAETQVAVTKLNGDIQARLADMAFSHDRILNDELHRDRLGEIGLTGDINLARDSINNEATIARDAANNEATLARDTAMVTANKEAQYLQNYLTTYDATLGRIDSLNGVEMDDAARERAQKAIWEAFDGQTKLLEALYPDVTPIEFG